MMLLMRVQVRSVNYSFIYEHELMMFLFFTISTNREGLSSALAVRRQKVQGKVA
jgi:hypothetical protein